MLVFKSTLINISSECTDDRNKYKIEESNFYNGFLKIGKNFTRLHVTPLDSKGLESAVYKQKTRERPAEI
jgi:hypothetical protein